MLRLLILTFLLLVLDERGTASLKQEATALTRAKRQIILNNLFVTNKNKICILQKHADTGSRSAGDLYIGTTKGVYLKYVGTQTIIKIGGITEPISEIQSDFNGGAFVITSTGKLYYLNQDGENDQGVQSYIPDKILSMGILQENSTGSRKAGDMYIGTTEGVYLKYAWSHNTKKVEDINEPVSEIKIDYNGAAYVITSNGKLYYIDENGNNDPEGQVYIQDEIISIGILEQNSSGTLKAGDLYIGTTEGLYLKYLGTPIAQKMKGIEEPVTSIYIDFNGGAYVITSTGKLYVIHQGGEHHHTKIGVPDKVLSVGVLKNDSSGSGNASGIVYIGTIEGVYLKYVGINTIKKVEGIDEPVTEINIDFNDGAYVITSTGKLYYINENGDNLQGVLSYIPAKIL